jgi:cytochrome c553
MRFFQRRAALAATLFSALALFACQPAAPPEPPAQPADAAPAANARAAQDPIERGKMLVFGGGCHDCHTTKKMTPAGPEPDMEQMLGGHPESIKIAAPFKPAAGSPWTIATNDTLTAWSGPWGVSFAPNLTPDPDTGMRMTERNFVIAIKTGSHLGTARPILPPMPWQQYRELSEDDLKALYAYLRSIPPIKNRVPEPIPPAK